MTRSHCARQLLRLGPLQFRDYWQITGWPRKQARDVLDRLISRGEVKRMTERGTNRFLYGMAE